MQHFFYKKMKKKEKKCHILYKVGAKIVRSAQRVT